MEDSDKMKKWRCGGRRKSEKRMNGFFEYGGGGRLWICRMGDIGLVEGLVGWWGGGGHVAL